jgi:hypothetical protein
MKLIWGNHINNPQLPLLVRWKTEGGDARDLNRSGVYIIRNSLTNRVHVGYTGNLQRRYDLIKGLLEKNKFKDVCLKLQAEYNLYGKENIHFVPKEICIDRKCTYGRWLHISRWHKEIKKDKLYEFNIGQIRSILRSKDD